MRAFRILCWVYLFLVLILPLLTLGRLLPALDWSWGLFFSPSFKNSLLVAGGTSLLSTSLALPAAFLLAKTDLRRKSFWLLFLVLPVLFVPYQFALAWSNLWPQKWHQALFGPWGVILVLSNCLFPISLVFAWRALKQVPAEEEEAALLVAPPLKVLYRITWPKIWPATVASGVLVFLMAFTNLGVPTYLGLPVLPYEVLIQFATLYDFSSALAAAFPMASVALILLALEYRLLPRKIFSLSRKARPGLCFNLGPWRLLAWGYLAFLVVFGVLLPLGSLLKEAWEKEALVFALENGFSSLLRSLSYALGSAFLAACWGLLSLYTRGGKKNALFSSLTLAGFFLPPPIIATALIYLYSKLPVLSLAYGSSLLLLQGLLVRFSFLSYQTQEVAFELLPRGPWEAALLTGHRSLTILRRIIFPPLKPWFFLAVILVFVLSMNELGLSVMLYPPHGEPLVVRLYTLTVNNPLSYAAALACLNSLGCLVGVFCLYRWGIK